MGRIAKHYAGNNLFFIRMLVVISFIILELPKTTTGQTPAINQQTQPPNRGNFALAASQQPGPFFSFGQNIIDKNQVQVYLEPNYLQDPSQHYLSIPTAFLYGLSDNSSIFITLPVAANYKSGTHHSSGLSDLSVQGEYAFYENNNSQYNEQMTVVGGLTAPSGSFKKNPPTGYGTNSYFIGGTYSRMSEDWLWFASPGLIWVSTYHQIHTGSQYLYQLGLGRNIKSVPDHYIFSALVEMDGTYMEKNKVLGRFNPNTGGNLIFITPSLLFSTKKLYLQLGISLPLAQQWNGEQSKVNYYALASVGWTFV